MARRGRARKSQKDHLKELRSKVEAARRWRSTEGYDSLWSRMIDLYSGKHFDGLSERDRIAVNIAFATVNIIYPSVTVNHPKITLQARSPEGHAKAAIAESVLDYEWKSDQIGAGDEFRLAVKDSLIMGHGWVKTGWRYRTATQDRDPDAVEQDIAEAMSEMGDAAAANPELAGDMPTDDDIRAGVPTTEQATTEDRLFVERVSPFDVFVDPEATSERNMRWIAHRMIRDLDEVREDDRYEAGVRRSVEADRAIRTYDEQTGARKPSASEKRVTVWEFYDLAANQMCVFAQGGDGFLVKPREIPLSIGHPFVMIPGYSVPEHFYPMGDLESIEALQHELNRTRTQLNQARSSYARKYLVAEEAITPTVRAALESREDGTVVPIPTVNGLTPEAAVRVAPIHQVPGDLFGYAEQVEGDINTVSAVSEYQRGNASTVRRTATEAAMIQDAANSRAADKLATIERSIARVGKNMLELTRQFMTGEKVARIVGREGMPIWIPYTQENIDVDVDFAVEGGSTQPKNEVWRQNQATQLVQALGPLVGSVVDPGEIARFVLEMFDVKVPERFLMQQPPMGMGGPPPGGGPPEDEMGGPPMPPMPMPDAGGGDGGEMGLPPELLAQLGGQVGLDLGSPQ